jgi:rubredoxin
MQKYFCPICDYEYDEEAGDPYHGIAPFTTWEELSENFVCPLCGTSKEIFKKI